MLLLRYRERCTCRDENSGGRFGHAGARLPAFPQPVPGWCRSVTGKLRRGRSHRPARVRNHPIVKMSTTWSGSTENGLSSPFTASPDTGRKARAPLIARDLEGSRRPGYRRRPPLRPEAGLALKHAGGMDVDSPRWSEAQPWIMRRPRGIPPQRGGRGRCLPNQMETFRRCVRSISRIVTSATE